jgi:hypothetical protein
MKLKAASLAVLAALGALSAQAAIVTVPHDTNYTTNTTWSSANEYVLDGFVYVKAGATLTIEPGTIIRSQPRASAGTYNPGTIVITKDGFINAVGTSTNPIIFTTAAIPVSGSDRRPLDANADGIADRWVSGEFLDSDPKNSPLPPSYVKVLNDPVPGAVSSNVPMAGLGGGIIFLGNAPTNRDNTVALGGGLFSIGQSYIEGLPENADTVYGGNQPHHNGGRIAYVSIRHGGNNLAANNEINGLTLAGVGDGTFVQNIDIYCNLDDGIEIFGGTVNLKYLNINFAEDDSFDIDQGWTGIAQFIFALQHPNYGDALGEFDGHDEDSANGGSGGADRMTVDGRPYQSSIVANGTWIGRGTGVREGLRMRAGFGGRVLNNLVSGAVSAYRIDAITGIETDGFDSRTKALTAELFIGGNTANDCTNVSTTFTKSSGTVQGTYTTTTAALVNRTADIGFKPFDVNVANGVNPVSGRPGQGGSPAAVGNPVALPNNPFLTTTTFRGAFSTAGGSALWTNGWTALNKRGILVNTGNN